MGYQTPSSQGNNFENYTQIRTIQLIASDYEARHFFSYDTCFTLKENVNSQAVHQVPLHNLKLRGQCTVSMHKIKGPFVLSKEQ